MTSNSLSSHPPSYCGKIIVIILNDTKEFVLKRVIIVTYFVTSSANKVDEDVLVAVHSLLRISSLLFAIIPVFILIEYKGKFF